MAKIQNVDYMAMPGPAKQMRALGKQLNTQMTTAYKSIENMHSSWYGKRYNELVKSFNNITTQINEMLTLVVTDIPYTLETVANNYSQADRGQNATSASKESIQRINNINLSNDVGMKFITTNVAEVQKSVLNNFKNAKEQMNQIGAEYNKIKWESEASQAFKSKFQSLKTSITKSFDDIMRDFSKLMNQTLDDIQKAEKANTVS